MTQRSDNWQVFMEVASRAFWNTAKVFHFIGRVSGRVAEELGYRDDFPFGTGSLEFTPEDVNDQLGDNYQSIPVDDGDEIEDPYDHDEPQATMHWFQQAGDDL